MKLILIGIMLSLALSGCASQGGFQKVAQQEQISYMDKMKPDPKAEEILVKAFAASPVPWDKESAARAATARNSIQTMGEFLALNLSVDGSIPYYTYKTGAEFVRNQYGILQKELDARRDIKGGLSPEAQVIYYYVKRDINERLAIQQRKIDLTEKSINDKASQDTISEMKAIFAAVKPLLDIVI